METTIIITIITTLGTCLVAVIGALPKILEVLQRIRSLREEVDALKGRVSSLEEDLEKEKRLTARLLRILRQALEALRGHEPETVDRLRHDNADLDL